MNSWVKAADDDSLRFFFFLLQSHTGDEYNVEQHEKRGSKRDVPICGYIPVETKEGDQTYLLASVN